MVLNWEKNTSRRVSDEKNIAVWDILSLCYRNKKEFAVWEVIWVKETTFGNLTVEDLEWHEKFDSKQKMYETYCGYYKPLVIDEKTLLKVIKFKLI